MIERTDDRHVMAAVEIDGRASLLYERAIDNLALHAHVLVDFGSPAHGAKGRVAMREREVSSLRVEEVEVEVTREVPEESYTLVVEANAFGGQVIGSYDRGVSSGAATADVALLQNRDVGNSVIAGQVVRAGEAVSASPDDDHIVSALEPFRLPKHSRLRIFFAQREA